MFMTLDYLLLMLPAFLLSLWAQGRIWRAYGAGLRIPSAAGVTGEEAARIVLREAGVSGVAIEPAAGDLADHYDPRNKVLRLSRPVYGGRSLAALGVAAHEAGHAAQDAAEYPGLVLRNLIVPLASLGSELFWLLMAAGYTLGVPRLVLWGVVLLSLVVLLQVLNLPIEFDASRRGRRLLANARLATPQEDAVITRVLAAAAWTYVAAALTGAATVLDHLFRPGISGQQRQD